MSGAAQVTIASVLIGAYLIVSAATFGYVAHYDHDTCPREEHGLCAMFNAAIWPLYVPYRIAFVVAAPGGNP